MQYVPSRGEDVPCHHVPLDAKNNTVATLNEMQAEEAIKQWLRREINRLERELAVG